LLQPIATLNITRVYDQYAGFIDLLVYLVVFNGVARVALEKRFSGRSGSLLVNGIGVVLALAMVIAQSQFGFNLRSFGPVAGVLLLVVVGVTLHGFLRRVGASQGLSSSLAVLVLYFSLSALSPDLLLSVLERLPWLSLVPIIAFVLALWHVG